MSKNIRMIPELYDRHMDRLTGRQEDGDAALEAAREEGAEIAARELLRAAERSTENAAQESPDWQMRTFIARFCGGIESAFPELAREIARGAGMGHIYSTDEN